MPEVPKGRMIGLNLRMTETTAAIACTQLSRAKQIINNRIEFANEITEMFSGVPWIRPPIEDVGCKHVFYIWGGLVANGKRPALVNYLNIMGFPMKQGYSTPLTRIFDDARYIGNEYVTSRLEDHNLMTFEVCRYEPNWRQKKLMREIAKRAIGEIDNGHQGTRDWSDTTAVCSSRDISKPLRASH